jgi:erythromycin esterase
MNFEEIAKKIYDHRIIGLGEATHGQLKINVFRNRLIKILVKKYNFRVIALEEEYSCAKNIDKYVKSGVNDIISNITAFPFYTESFIRLLRWLKMYNKKNKNCVSIIGFDCQETCSEYNSESRMDKYVNSIVEKFKEDSKIRDELMFLIFMKQFRKKNKYVIIGHNQVVA